MPVYMILEIEVRDPETYAEYVRRVPETVTKYGGRYLVRGGQAIPLAGGWAPQRLVVLEFASFEAMRRWNESPEYREVAALRERSATTRAVAVQGCAPEGA